MLIIDGQSDHNWTLTTAQLKGFLHSTGRFAVEVATTPATNAPPPDWARFNPDFSGCDVVLCNYTGQLWPRPVRESLYRFVQGGGGLVVLHAAVKAFPEWDEWNSMTGLGWRDKQTGVRLRYDADGKMTRMRPGEGRGSGTGVPHPFVVVTRNLKHPITRGLPPAWLHPRDEIFHALRGPARGVTVLATAFSSEQTGGTGAHEPVVWVLRHGEGRVFVNVLGHVGRRSEDPRPLLCVGFQTLLARACEWTGTGWVTLSVPREFPTVRETSLNLPRAAGQREQRVLSPSGLDFPT